LPAFFFLFFAACANLVIFLTPYFLIPTLAATAAGFSYPASLAFFSIAANHLPLPNLGFLAILRPPSISF